MKDKITEFLDKKYKNREDVNNIFGVGVSDKEFIHYIIQYLLGEDWYVTDSIGPVQVNEVALINILHKYSKEYRDEVKEYREREYGVKESTSFVKKLSLLFGLPLFITILLVGCTSNAENVVNADPNHVIEVYSGERLIDEFEGDDVKISTFGNQITIKDEHNKKISNVLGNYTVIDKRYTNE